MFKPRLQIDPGLIVALLLATFAAWPFLTRPSLPTFTDTEQHVYRTFEIIAAWQAGVPYLRWAPDLFHAFGYPVFHYYAPLTYYLAAAYGALGGGAVAGVKFVYVASAYVGTTGTYLFVRDEWGGTAGLVSAAAFGLAPFVVYFNPHALGHAPESFALALAPLTLWTFACVRRDPSPSRMALAALTFAALILSHNFTALIFFGILLAWLVWEFVVALRPAKAREAGKAVPESNAPWKTLAALGAAATLGLGLSAFMWLPALLERSAVQLNNVTVGPYLDFHRNFVRLPELLAPASVNDLQDTRALKFKLGLAQWTLAALGGLSCLWMRARRATALFFFASAIILIYLTLPMSLPVWEAVPPMASLSSHGACSAHSP